VNSNTTGWLVRARASSIIGNRSLAPWASCVQVR
jgi:hypothetical protein